MLVNSVPLSETIVLGMVYHRMVDWGGCGRVQCTNPRAQAGRASDSLIQSNRVLP